MKSRHVWPWTLKLEGICSGTSRSGVAFLAHSHLYIFHGTPCLAFPHTFSMASSIRNRDKDSVFSRTLGLNDPPGNSKVGELGRISKTLSNFFSLATFVQAKRPPWKSR
jgi:hypothetical protein